MLRTQLSCPWINAIKCLFLKWACGPRVTSVASLRKHADRSIPGPCTEFLQQNFYSLESSPLQPQIVGISNPHCYFSEKEVVFALIVISKSLTINLTLTFGCAARLIPYGHPGVDLNHRTDWGEGSAHPPASAGGDQGCSPSSDHEALPNITHLSSVHWRWCHMRGSMESWQHLWKGLTCLEVCSQAILSHSYLGYHTYCHFHPLWEASYFHFCKWGKQGGEDRVPWPFTK